MKVTTYPQLLNKKTITLVIGAFSAMHFGHLALFEAAKTMRLPVGVLIINQTDMRIPTKSHLKDYAQFNVRLEHLAGLGIEYALVVNFNQAIANTPGEQFLNEIATRYHVKHIVVGEDFAMGFNRDLSASKMQTLYPTTIVETVKFEGKKLTGAVMRELVTTGDMEIIKKLAPFPFAVNISVSNDLTFVWPMDIVMPQNGIYAANVIVNNLRYGACVRIGYESASLTISNFPAIESAAHKKLSVTLEFHKLIRVITRIDKDSMSDDDQSASFNYLINNQINKLANV